ncbi:MAG TPA: copper-binding protein [Micavibrio sp.]
MKKFLLATALVMLATPALAKDYTIKEVSDPAGDKPYYFDPAELTIQPGDTVTFVNAQEDQHDVMFIGVPKTVDEMIMSPMFEKEGEKWSYTFTVPGTYNYHCHPHEAAGMKGTIIVGQASASEDMKIVDHEEMEHHMEGMEMGTDHQHMMDMEHMHDMKGMGEKAADNAAASNLIEATGKINSIDAEKHTVNVSHDPIAALGWPKMTMEFPIAKDVDLSGFKVGDDVEFTLTPGGNDQYSIVSLKAHSHNH